MEDNTWFKKPSMAQIRIFKKQYCESGLNYSESSCKFKSSGSDSSYLKHICKFVLQYKTKIYIYIWQTMWKTNSTK